MKGAVGMKSIKDRMDTNLASEPRGTLPMHSQGWGGPERCVGGLLLHIPKLPPYLGKPP